MNWERWHCGTGWNLNLPYIKIEVYWSEGQYYIRIAGRQLNKSFDNVDAAKTYSLQTARYFLSKSLTEINRLLQEQTNAT